MSELPKHNVRLRTILEQTADILSTRPSFKIKNIFDAVYEVNIFLIANFVVNLNLQGIIQLRQIRIKAITAYFIDVAV